jgi:uncharacterized protein YjbI with pentapeptide repeats
MEGDNMANAEHLAVLRQGAAAWERWLKQHPHAKPDLSKTTLAEENFTMVDLRGADLTGADLHRTDLRWADLRGVNLSRATLVDARLSGADLTSGNLMQANLRGADLSSAVLRGANLYHVNLHYCQLTGADLSAADLTGAMLYGAARDDWTIEGIKCLYIFWDSNGLQRSPTGRDLASGEFERLYRTLPTIEYVFQGGMTPLDPLIMDRVVQAIREQNPEYDIKIDSISARGLAPSIKFTVQREEQKESALRMVVAGYESRIRSLETDKARLFEKVGQLIDIMGELAAADRDQLHQDLRRAINQAGPKLLVAGGDIIHAEDNATISIDQHVEYIANLRDAVAALPDDSPTFGKVAKKTALDIIGGLLKKAAEGQMKEAAKQLYELGKEFGPVVLSSAAYAALKSMMPGG